MFFFRTFFCSKSFHHSLNDSGQGLLMEPSVIILYLLYLSKKSFLDGIMLVLLSIFIDLHCPWLLSDRARYYLLEVGSSAVFIDWHSSSLIWINLCHLVIIGYTWNTVSCQKTEENQENITFQTGFYSILWPSWFAVPFCLKKIKRTACSELLRCIRWSSSCVCVLELQSDQANPRTVPLHWSIGRASA